MFDRDDSNDRRRAADGLVCCSVGRRRAFGWLLLPAAQLIVPSVARANVAHIASARMWHAHEYTRVVLEAPVGYLDGLEEQLRTRRDRHLRHLLLRLLRRLYGLVYVCLDALGH